MTTLSGNANYSNLNITTNGELLVGKGITLDLDGGSHQISGKLVVEGGSINSYSDLDNYPDGGFNTDVGYHRYYSKLVDSVCGTVNVVGNANVSTTGSFELLSHSRSNISSLGKITNNGNVVVHGAYNDIAFSTESVEVNLGIEDAKLDISGELVNAKTMNIGEYSTCNVYKSGKLTNTGTIDITGVYNPMTEYGSSEQFSSLNSSGALINSGTLNLHEFSFVKISNNSKFENTGDISVTGDEENSSYIIVNGTFDNKKKLNLLDNSYLELYKTLNNSGSIYAKNTGSITKEWIEDECDSGCDEECDGDHGGYFETISDKYAIFIKRGGKLNNTGMIELDKQSGIKIKEKGSLDNSGTIKMTGDTENGENTEIYADGSITNVGTLYMNTWSYIGSYAEFKNTGEIHMKDIAGIDISDLFSNEGELTIKGRDNQEYEPDFSVINVYYGGKLENKKNIQMLEYSRISVQSDDCFSNSGTITMECDGDDNHRTEIRISEDASGTNEKDGKILLKNYSAIVGGTNGSCSGEFINKGYIELTGTKDFRTAIIVNGTFTNAETGTVVFNEYGRLVVRDSCTFENYGTVNMSNMSILNIWKNDGVINCYEDSILMLPDVVTKPNNKLTITLHEGAKLQYSKYLPEVVGGRVSITERDEYNLKATKFKFIDEDGGKIASPKVTASDYQNSFNISELTLLENINSNGVNLVLPTDHIDPTIDRDCEINFNMFIPSNITININHDVVVNGNISGKGTIIVEKGASLQTNGTVLGVRILNKGVKVFA